MMFLLLRLYLGALYAVYYVVSLFAPDRWFKHSRLYYRARLRKYDISWRFTQIAELSDYNHHALIRWLTILRYIRCDLSAPLYIDDRYIDLTTTQLDYPTNYIE